MKKSLESRRTIRSRITIVPNIEAPRDMSPLGVFFCPHVFPKLLIFNDLRRAARHKPLMIKHLRQNAKNFTFFLQLLGIGVTMYLVLLTITLSQRVLSELQIGGDKRGADCSPN